MFTFTTAFLAVVLALCHAPVSVQLASIRTVDLGYATYQTGAETDTGVISFLGMRYAAPPKGNLSFCAPQPPEKMSGVQNASVQPDECWQSADGTNASTPFVLNKRTADVQNEGCRFLNVHIPADIEPHESLPAIVWIHGGGRWCWGEKSRSEHGPKLEQQPGICANAISTRAFRVLTAGETVARDGVLNAGIIAGSGFL